MDISENQSYDDFSLRKDEIIRGNDSYLRVLQNSISVSTEYLKAFVNQQGSETDLIDHTISPHFTSFVKVGFIIAKKKIRKSFFRNRIRRLLKESYRLNRSFSGINTLKLNIIFSLTDRGYNFFKKFPATKRDFTDLEMKLLLSKVINKFNQ